MDGTMDGKIEFFFTWYIVSFAEHFTLGLKPLTSVWDFLLCTYQVYKFIISGNILKARNPVIM